MKSGPITEIKNIEFTINEISNKALRQIKLTSDAVTFFYHSALNYHPDQIIPLQTDSLAFNIEDSSFDNSPNAVRNRSMDWLFRKAFEEFIVGLTESLIEAYRFLKCADLSKTSKQNKNMTEEDIDLHVEEINIRPRKMPFPNLLAAIEDELKVVLPLRDEILSINSIRNCLVHRNALVSKLDIKDSSSGILKLQYLDLVTFYEKEGEMVEMKWEHKKEKLNTNQLQFRETPKIIGFAEGQHITLDQNIFNGVSYTCTTFLQTLQHLAVTQNIDIIKLKPKQ